jgi:hypothetical protein
MPTVGIFRDLFSIVKSYSWKLLFTGLRAINRKLLGFWESLREASTTWSANTICTSKKTTTATYFTEKIFRQL